MVAHDLERTDEGMLDIINDIYDYTKVNGYAFYLLTSSSRQVIDQWNDHTGAAYPYLQADDIMLKTMIRSNPGLIVLKDATIIGKLSAADMPRDEHLNVPMERNKSIEVTARELEARRISMALWMFFPLLLLVIIDKNLKNKNTSINN